MSRDLDSAAFRKAWDEFQISPLFAMLMEWTDQNEESKKSALFKAFLAGFKKAFDTIR